MAWSGSGITTAMSMHSRLIEQMRRARGWLIPAALLTLAPKCILCVLAYAGLGTALGLGGQEICSASSEATGHWTVWLPVLAGVVAVVMRITSCHVSTIGPVKGHSRPERTVSVLDSTFPSKSTR